MNFSSRCRRNSVALGFALVLAALCPSAHAQKELRVAAAADLQFVMPELAQQFEKQSGTKLVVSFGSSGNFFSQIHNGAPFDLFFSADLNYPKKLDAAGLCDPGTLQTYASGRIVIWAPANSSLDVTSLGWKALLDPAIKKIAIANPDHAPYGQAAVAALKSAGIYEQVKDKLVYGENISQTAQFVQSGNAQAGILALSLVLAPAMRRGHQWEIPQKLYPPLEQGAAVLTSSKDKTLARSFLQFVQSRQGRDILARWGFRTPVTPVANPGP